ncbi:hypothetical protein OG601_18970 [Streptomyces sp. NBC_01239]|uniref:hypothetical protein n=1 Tax=Streptomyces sp. NBC_01239 TaxID=2903792 RepID=UPI00225B72E2|nr:hypothetical protein [Streptomyces sp. NBC_01239]MCX4812679.1 hypothetical protein [Streptomyces sp. NBC_01239]
MNRPLPHQLIQVPPAQAVSPPVIPPAPLPVVRQQRPPAPPPAPVATPPPARRRRRFRTPRALREDAFWTGALTAMCIGGLLLAIIATG